LSLEWVLTTLQNNLGAITIAILTGVLTYAGTRGQERSGLRSATAQARANVIVAGLDKNKETTELQGLLNLVSDRELERHWWWDSLFWDPRYEIHRGDRGIQLRVPRGHYGPGKDVAAGTIENGLITITIRTSQWQ
jgi:hypothetical protein